MLDRYDAVLAALDAGVVIHASDTTILDANARARSLLGLQDLEGRLATDPQWDFLEADGSPMSLERFPVMQVIASREELRGLIMVIRPPGGTDIWLEVNAVPIVDDSGALEQVVVTFIDITEGQRAKESRAEQAERLELVLAASRLGLWDWDLVTGETVLDERWAEIVGYRLVDLQPTTIDTWRRLAHPDDLADAEARIAEHAGGQLPFYDHTFRMRHHDGNWVWVHDRGRIVEWTRDGEPLRMTGTLEDVTVAHQVSEELAATEEESRLAFDRSSVPTCLVANDGRIIRVNAALCDLFGYAAEELLAKTFLDVTHPDDLLVGADRLGDMLTGRLASLRLTKRYVASSGRVIWGDVTVSAVRDADGSIRHRIAQILDVTAEHDLREALMTAERIAQLGAWRLDLATGHVTWSPQLFVMFVMFGLAPAPAAPDFPEQERLLTPESWKRLGDAVAQTRDTGVPYSLELEIIRADGVHRWAEARGEAIRDVNGAIVELQGTSLDITDRKLARDELQELATRDPLTGLANRAALVDEITRAVSASQRSSRVTAILMMDLDRFKTVNDTLGHTVGDALLVAAAGRLTDTVRAGDLVARLGGDEFVVVLRDLPDPAEAVAAADRLVQAFRTPFAIDDRELFATASVGVAVATGTAAAGDLLREADTAMYAAKEAGRDRHSLFSEDLRTLATTRMTVEADLRHALDRGQLTLWYQPEVELASGAVVAVEALLRWHHPEGRVWTADRFVDIAEDTGLILDIGDWVIRQACAQGAALAAQHPDHPLTVRVNLSALQLAEAGLIEAVDEALGSSGMDPRMLCAEITETALLRRTSITAANLSALHDRGISLAIDDFGTGYASLTYLSRYPIDVIKIDRSFIGDASEHSGRLLAGIIALAATLGIDVTAEGVERSDQADRLRRMGCPTAQGWLYSAAVPPEEITPLLSHVYPHP